MLKTKKVVLALFLSLVVIQINASSPSSPVPTRSRANTEDMTVDELAKQTAINNYKISALQLKTLQSQLQPARPSETVPVQPGLVSKACGKVSTAGFAVLNQINKPLCKLYRTDVDVTAGHVLLGAGVASLTALVLAAGDRGYLGKNGTRATGFLKGLPGRLARKK